MEISSILPLLFTGGIVGGFIAALRWGREDARDSAEASASNTATAMTLRDAAIEENAKLRVELAAMHVENARLVAMMRAAGIDPTPGVKHDADTGT